MSSYALVTGASGGIGLELARCFAADKRSLILVARSTPQLEELARELSAKHGIDARACTLDLTEPGAASRLYEWTKAQGIPVDALVNNAGFGGYGDFWETDLAHETRMIDLNVTALVQLTKLFLQDMIKNRHGRILNVASTAAFQPGPLMSIYYATKAFVLSFSEALSNETRGTGVTVTALCPGPTETNFRAAAGIKKSMLFSKNLYVPVGEVARTGYEGMKAGKTIVIPGFKNRMVAFMVRFLPRDFVTKSVRKVQEARRD